MREHANDSVSAGFVLLDKTLLTQGIEKILVLVRYGHFDLPKGQIEESESDLDAARRETDEEASITNIEMLWGDECYNGENVVIFVGVTDQEARIDKNPVTGIYEHHSAKWVSWEEAISKSTNRVRNAITWARDFVRSSNRD